MSEADENSLDRSSVESAFDRVVTTMGSLRQAAFADLRKLLAGHGHDGQLAGLAELDVESTTFEAEFRGLQEQVLAELDSAEG